MPAKKRAPYKRKKVESTGSRGGKIPSLDDKELAEAAKAAEKLAKRPTKDFSTEELGALMQVAPGGAEPHQIKTKSRQFRRILPHVRTNIEPRSAYDMDEGSSASVPAPTPGKRSAGANKPDSKRRPLSLTNYKIDPEE